MIVFDLQCVNDHNFEGWFEDNQAYHDQKKKGLITCPICSNSDVTKILSPCAIKTSGSSGTLSQVTSEQQQKLQAFARMSQEVAEYVKKNFDDVGADFSKEALKIHYGVTEPRNIRGVSTESEEKMMKSEGIDFVKIPIPSSPDQDS